MYKIYLLFVALLLSAGAMAQVGPITGTFSICATYQTTLSCTPAGGTWSSTNPSIASIGSSNGVVTGNSAGVVTISYNAGSPGVATATFTVNPLPATIVCPTSGCNVCLGDSITVTDPTPGGIWSTQNPSIATVGSSSGVVIGVTVGTTILSYALVPTGCFVTSLITVNANPLSFSMTGGGSYCSGGSGLPIGLSGSQVGVNYQLMCGASPVGSPVAGTGSAISFGLQTSACTYTVIATNASGCHTVIGSATITINPSPGPISCVSSAGTGCNVCVGSTLSLVNAVPGGVWSSGNTPVATIGSSSGILTGVTSGTVTIVYTLPGGCSTSTTVVVNPNPSSITGILTICVGNTTTLSATAPPGTPPGTWISGATGIATVGSSSGIVTGVSAGVAPITYMLPSGCFSVANVTVNPTPGPIVCPVSSGCKVCVGSTISLTNSVTGGVWTSGNTALATVGSSTGVVTGVSPGTVTITYTLPGGCFATANIIVNASPAPITGITNVCVGATTTLFNSTTGGTWSSSNTTIATVGSSSGIVTGVSPGVAIITYTLANGCFVTTNVTVDPRPAISGSYTTCVGATTTLTGTPTGGTWISGAPSVGTISAGGVVTGITPGTTNITYTSPSGCVAVVVVTVTPAPGPIACPSSGCNVCVGATALVTNPIPGGTWSSSNISIATVGSTSGIITGVSVGTSYITYTLGGCIVTTLYTVNPAPIAFTVTGGGSYCSGTPGIPVGLSGSQLGVNYQLYCGMSPVGPLVPGTGAAISFGPQPGTCTYTVVAVNAWGCTTTMTGSVTVIANPMPLPISCPAPGCTVCTGANITLTSASPGGTWTSSNTGIATVGSSTGVVTGVTAGITIITYMLPGGCFVTASVTVNTSPAPIAGPTTVCVSNAMMLTDATAGGTWSTSCTNATVNSSSGLVTGVAVGPCNSITYTLPGGCYATYAVTVTPHPCTAGLEESASLAEVIIFPNPAHEELIVQTSGQAFSSLTITNQVGQTVISSLINSGEMDLDIRSLPAGLFYVTLRGEKGVVVRRFVKF